MWNPNAARRAAIVVVAAFGLGACAGTPDERPLQERVAAAAAAEAGGRSAPMLCESQVQHPAAGSAVRCRTPEEVSADRESAKSALLEYRRIGRVRGAKW